MKVIDVLTQIRELNELTNNLQKLEDYLTSMSIDDINHINNTSGITTEIKTMIHQAKTQIEKDALLYDMALKNAELEPLHIIDMGDTAPIPCNTWVGQPGNIKFKPSKQTEES